MNEQMAKFQMMLMDVKHHGKQRFFGNTDSNRCYTITERV